MKGLKEEVQKSLELTHPNIIRAYDLVESPQEAAFITMEFVEGEVLSDKLKQQPEGRFVWPDLEPYILNLCDALEYAHERGMVHRDLKPENILLEEDGQALVADFGIARCLHGEGGQSHTRAGVAMGTPAYMPPEQVRDARSADHRADIYALGVILYEMLSGRPPFAGQDPVAIVSRVEAGDYPPLAQTEDPVGQALGSTRVSGKVT